MMDDQTLDARNVDALETYDRAAENGPPEYAGGAGCPHPPTRLHSWYARDDRATAPVLCVACSQCGAILRGAV